MTITDLLQVVRADKGTEHAVMTDLQQFLCADHDDSLAGEKCFRYGRSTANQQIEWWWGLLQKEGGQHWINIFQGFTDEGLLWR